MRETKTRTIGSAFYAVNQLGALEGRKVLARLVAMFGGMVGAIGEGGKADLVRGFSSLANAITEDQMEFFCDTFSPWTQVTKDGKTRVLKDCFDDHFVANYGEMVEWLGFCLEVNFASFLGGTGGIASLFSPKVPAA